MFSRLNTGLKYIKKVLRKKRFSLPILLTFVFIVWVWIVISVSGDSEFKGELANKIVNDVTQLNPIYVGEIIRPESVEEIVAAVKSTTGPISIGGGRYSQGGQIAYENSLHLDMRSFNKVIGFNPEAKEITVQPGITWRNIQEHIDPHNLSIKIMQTYANFTVGGSMSVNVHGRYISLGPLVMSVKSLKLVKADGELVFASPENNSEIFYGVIGGYGGLGIIVEATLSLDDNVKVERRTVPMKIADYKKYFFDKIRDNPEVVFHNADIYPPEYEDVLDVSWYKTKKPVTIDERLIPADRKYPLQPHLVDFVSGSSFGKWIRKNIFDPYYYSGERIVWRNWEASYDIKELEPSSREEFTYVLREYFVPVEKFDEFYPKMRDIFNKNQVNVVNVSIRHAKKDPGTLLAWAKTEVFAFVVYYRQKTTEEEKLKVKKWTQEIIDAVLKVGGAYYLPYQIYATPEQFSEAYPRSNEFFALKEKLDPDNRFINKLWDKYYPKNKSTLKTEAKNIPQYFRGEEQTFLTLPEWYLVFNPKEYADFLESSNNNPSNFPFYESLDEYWSLYDRVLHITDGVYPSNAEYKTMLQVIGVSTTLEYIIKSLYENTIGRFTRWTAGGQDTTEDQIIAKGHRAYSDFIYHTAWYEFDFSSWVNKIWHDTDFFGANFIRKFERKLFFSTEFLVKTIYAKLIGFGAKTAYEESDGLIYAKVEAPSVESLEVDKRVQVLLTEGTKHLIAMPRWGPFSEIVPKLANTNVRFLDISGNDEILISLIANKNSDKPIKYGKKLFESRIVSDQDKTRLVLLVKVQELGEAIKSYMESFSNIEHVYDY